MATACSIIILTLLMGYKCLREVVISVITFKDTSMPDYINLSPIKWNTRTWYGTTFTVTIKNQLSAVSNY